MMSKWVPVIALVIGLLMRLLKDDTIGPVVPPRLRPLMALALGVAYFTVTEMLSGKDLLSSLVSGLANGGVAGGAAIVGHDTLVNGLADGKELPVPGFLKKDE